MADNAQSVLRRLRELYNNPRLSLEQIIDNIQNFNKGRVAEASDRGAGYRALTPRERTDQAVRASLDNIGGGGMGALGVIKSKGGNWLSGSVENALSRLKKNQLWPDIETARELGADAATIARDTRKGMLNNWIEGPLTRYVKRDMATEGDPVRRLAEQGITHIADQTPYLPTANAIFLRGLHAPSINPKASAKDILNAQEGMAISDLAKNWENRADTALDAESIGAYLDPDTYFHKYREPWMETAPDKDATVFRTKGMSSRLNRPDNITGDLGFNHLIDELSNAMNPESGLPRNLMLNPEDFQQMGMERAVRHVHNINEWRAAQKAEADALRANNAATRLHKEYPENNPLGLRWVELKEPKQAPEFDGDTFYSPEDAYSMLRDALKYEGDTMGHCVGGYCDDVLEGRSRIFSLRDAKGQPHVTIEEHPNLIDMDEFSGGWIKGKMNQADAIKAIRELTKNPDWQERVGNRLTTGGLDNWIEDIVAYDRGRPVISQIKGSGKKDPNQRIRLAATGYSDNPDAHLLPFIQDFVKSGEWSSVGDLRNASMWKNPKTGEYHTLQELEGNPELEAIYETRNLDANGNYVGGFKKGGLVKADDDFAYPGMF